MVCRVCCFVCPDIQHSRSLVHASSHGTCFYEPSWMKTPSYCFMCLQCIASCLWFGGLQLDSKHLLNHFLLPLRQTTLLFIRCKNLCSFHYYHLFVQCFLITSNFSWQEVLFSIVLTTYFKNLLLQENPGKKGSSSGLYRLSVS